MSEAVRAVGEDEPQGVINGTTGAEHDEAEHDLQRGDDEDEDEDDEYDEEEAEYEEEKQIVGDDDDDDGDDYEEVDEEDNEGANGASKPSMTHLLLGNPNAPVDGDEFDDEEEDDEDEEDYELVVPAPSNLKKRSREELGEEDGQDSKKVKA